MPLIGNLMEVILYVENMQTMVSFYRDVMGLTIRYPGGKSDYQDEVWVTLDTGPCTLALHGGGQRRHGADAPTIVFQVNDIHNTRNALLDLGVKLGEVRSAAPGIWVCDGSDPEGNQFSIEAHEE